MSTDEELGLISGIHPKAWKILIYGTPGCGKSSWAAHAPDPVFLDLESGLDRIDCVKTPNRIKSLDDLKDWLRNLLKHPCKTIVIDTIDEIERMLAEKALDEYNADQARLDRKKKPLKSIEEVPYGRGGDLLAAEWRDVVDIFEAIRARGKNVLLVGHEQVLNFKNPAGEDYNFYGLNVHKKSAAVITAKMDAVFFARQEAHVREKESSDRHVATATGKRVVHPVEGGAWVAKNRFGLTDTVELSPSIFNLIV